MSLQETKANLLELLGDADSKVIALSGKWGTGKTHLWGEVMEASQDETVKGAIALDGQVANSEDSTTKTGVQMGVQNFFESQKNHKSYGFPSFFQ